MSCWEIVIMILVCGIVSMMEICVVMAAVSRMIDAKTKAKIDLTTSVFRNEMDYVDRVFDKYMTRIEKLVEKNSKKESSAKMVRFGKPDDPEE